MSTINFTGVDPTGPLTLGPGVDDPKEGGRHVKKTVPIRLLDQSELFEKTKLLAIWFIANFEQLSIDAHEDEKIARI